MAVYSCFLCRYSLVRSLLGFEASEPTKICNVDSLGQVIDQQGNGEYSKGRKPPLTRQKMEQNTSCAPLKPPTGVLGRRIFNLNGQNSRRSVSPSPAQRCDPIVEQVVHRPRLFSQKMKKQRRSRSHETLSRCRRSVLKLGVFGGSPPNLVPRTRNASNSQGTAHHRDQTVLPPLLLPTRKRPHASQETNALVYGDTEWHNPLFQAMDIGRFARRSQSFDVNESW